MAQLFEAQPSNDLPDVPNFNVCPTNQVHVITSEETGRRLSGMRWGFVPHWYKTLSDGPLLINARSETLAEKPAFRAACRARRCLILATGFYEWTKDAEGKRLPWYIAPTDGGLIAFAGVWQTWTKGDTSLSSCAIVTSAANGPIKSIHHRMPIAIAPNDWSLWLGEKGAGAAILMKAPRGDMFAFHRVAPAVNSNRAAGPALTEPI